VKYESIEFHGKASAEAAIARDDPSELLYVPVAASLYSPDWRWAQDLCARLAKHSDATVRGNAILGFGHLARRFPNLDRTVVAPLVRQALADSSPYVASQASNTIDDLQQYLGWALIE
jgi:hypothetical protein